MHLVTDMPDLLQRCSISNQISLRDAASLGFASPDKKKFLLNLSLGRVLEMHLVTEIPDLLQRCRISNQISVRDAASLGFASPDKKIFY